jgi:hypothetical protein
MVISAYQVNNMLRVYGDQLRQNRVSQRPNNTRMAEPDRINISEKARRKSIVDMISSNIVDRITRNGPNDDVEKEIFEKLENEYGKNLTISKEGAANLIFKEIDKDGETINSLSIEDSKFLSYKLKEITAETIGENIF